MNRKLLIRKVLTALFWLITGTGLVTLLVAANRPDGTHTIREVRITIKGDGEQFFIDKSDILLKLTVAARSPLVGKPLDRIRLDNLESLLEKGVWIRQAELWIDSRDVLHVLVTEREPVARIFNSAGASFYIDSSGQRMPLLEKESARVLVVTNYPGAAKFTHADSLRANEVKLLANTINADEFWKEQIAQIDITASGSFEAIPVVGNHIIRLGGASDIDKKLAHLKLFYRQVLARTGFDRYAVVDVQYKGQVVGVYRGATSVVDSMLLQQNIEALLARAQQQMLQDSIAAVQVAISADTARSHATLPMDSIGAIPEPADNSAAETPHAADTASRRAATSGPAVRQPVPARQQPAAARLQPAAARPAPGALLPKPNTGPVRRNTGQRPRATNEY